MAHTPGPWQPVWLRGDSRGSPSEVCTSDRNHSIAFMASDGRLADARLIAASPDLLEALQWFINDIDGTRTAMVDFDANVTRARAAIAKATAA